MKAVIRKHSNSGANRVREAVKRQRRGQPFSNHSLLRLGSRTAVDNALSRLVAEGSLMRLVPGVFVRPKQNPYVGNVVPEVSTIISAIAKSTGETIQVHGAEAARRFKLTTQVPMSPVFNTSGPSREYSIGKLKVALRHVSNRKLQLAGKRSGLALAALWYLGPERVGVEEIETIRQQLPAEEFEELRAVNKPVWLDRAFRRHEEATVTSA